MIDVGFANIACQKANIDVRRKGDDGTQFKADDIALEVPVALVYNCISHAVMMTSPTDLEDFALGFSLSEGIVQYADEITDITCINEGETGFSVQLQISEARLADLQTRRRNMTGRTGCGLCGTESLKDAIRPISTVKSIEVKDSIIQKALTLLPEYQPLQQATGATHAAAWCDIDGNIVLVREDVGRHNALDKLIGAIVKKGLTGEQGFALVTSRASYEMVQKCCSIGIGCLIAVSAPTILAIEQARQAGLMLVGFARNGRHIIYNNPFAIVKAGDALIERLG
jgi:FdhD protein